MHFPVEVHFLSEIVFGVFCLQVQQCGLLKAQLMECEERVKWMNTHAEELQLQLQQTQQGADSRLEEIQSDFLKPLEWIWADAAFSSEMWDVDVNVSH